MNRKGPLKLFIFIALIILGLMGLDNPRIAAQDSSELHKVLLVAWDSTGQYLATSIFTTVTERSILVRDSETNEIIGSLENGEFYDFAWNPKRDVIAIAGSNGVELWDKNLRETSATINIVIPTSVSWSPDGRYLAILSGDIFSNPIRKITIWNTSTGESFSLLDDGSLELVVEVNWSPDGRYIVTIGARYTIWETQNYQRYQPMISLQRDGQYFLYGPNASLSAWSPDSQKIAIIGNDNVAASYAVQIWDINSGEIISTLEGPAEFLNTVGWSYDGRFLASGGHDNSIHIWDAQSVEVKSILTGHTDTISSISWDPQVTRLASASWDGTVRIWEIE